MPETEFSQAQQRTANAANASISLNGSERQDTKPRIRALHVLILGGLTAFAPLSTDMYLPSLPTISRDLGATTAQTQITLSACVIGLALGQLIIGPISDALGRRRPLLVGIATYVLASLLCIVAPSVAILAVLRLVQGAAGAAGIVIAFAMARDLYSGITLARCVSLLMLVTFLAPIAAPVLGSQLLTFTSWRGVFVTLALIGVVFFIAAATGLDETLLPEQQQRNGIATSLTAFHTLLADRRFVGYALTGGFAFAAGFTYISVSPFILQNIYGLSPQVFGLLFGVNALGLAAMAQISARLVGRVSPQQLLSWGVVMIGVAGVVLLGVVLGGIGLGGVLPILFVLVASLGFIAPNSTALALADVNSQMAGSASALLGALQFIIGAVVAPLVGLGGSTSAVPMALAIATFGAASLAIFLVLCRPVTLWANKALAPR